MRIFFYVQNLLGIGHILRALRVAQALAADGRDVELVLGGRPVPGLATAGVRLTQLPPIAAGAQGFTDLVDAEGRPLDGTGKARRRDALLAAFEAARPDVLLIEAFPFGRRQMRFELQPLLDAAHVSRPRPLVVASVRDILQETRRADRAEETVAALIRRFDHVIVHGDERIATLGDTFPLADRIAHMVSYSGIVGPGIVDPGAAVERHDVIVSAGGGAVGLSVLRCAIEAKPATVLKDARWLAITGPNLPAADQRIVEQRAAQNGVQLARFVPDLPARLTSAMLSVSQAGYNTMADVLAARCRAVVVPFAAGGETEQTRRAEALAARGLAVVLPDNGVTAEAMAAAIDRAMASDPAISGIDLGGAERTARLVADLLARHRAGGQ